VRGSRKNGSGACGPSPLGCHFHDRVKITMSGKFLPYKYHRASGNVPEVGFKEG
jgi:hypothetical protein